MIHVRTGQFAVVVDGRTLRVQPALLQWLRSAVTGELVEYFATVHGGKYPQRLPTDPDLRNRIMARCYGELVQTSIHILKCCSECEIGQLLGECNFTPSGKLRLKPGLMPTSDVITLAQHYVSPVLIGDGPEERRHNPGWQYKPTFDIPSMFTPPLLTWDCLNLKHRA